MHPKTIFKLALSGQVCTSLSQVHRRACLLAESQVFLELRESVHCVILVIY